MNKNSIRKLIIKQRIAMAKDEVAELSQLICKQILSLQEYKNAQTIGLYSATKNEVDLTKIWSDAKRNHKKCYFPKIIDNNAMIFLPANTLANFSLNKWGILEPEIHHKYQIANDALDLIILPLVAFDELGNRIGMGKGYYDKALAANNYSFLVGTAYDFQKISLIKTETWDIKLDIIVTETKVHCL